MTCFLRLWKGDCSQNQQETQRRFVSFEPVEIVQIYSANAHLAYLIVVPSMYMHYLTYVVACSTKTKSLSVEGNNKADGATVVTADEGHAALTQQEDQREFDMMRVLRAMTYGTGISAWLQFWWGSLQASANRLVPIFSTRTKLANVLYVVAVDQAIGASIVNAGEPTVDV